MNTFIRFFYEFISVFISGIVTMFKGIFGGIIQIFKYSDYKKILVDYKSTFSTFEWILVVISIIILISIIVGIVLLIGFGIKRLLNFRSQNINNEDLLDEIDELNQKVRTLMKEKDELMAMKVSQLGLNPDEEDNDNIDDNKQNGDSEEAGNIRFPKLVRIDELYKNTKIKNYGNTFNLEELVDDFRCFAASKLHLYYDITLLRSFVSGLASSKLIILQGISGTGKTSLAYAWGKFVSNNSCVASVQPSWRDKTELLGYFNEFTKKFNESNVLEELYAAGYDDNVHTIILDEMNIARVEYYFAEMLSILEIPQRSEWVIELVTTVWPDDPKKLKNGKLQLPGNLWYMGTINNDDSTFMVADKVYDRAMPIDINTKINPFECREQEAIPMNSSYLEGLFKEAFASHKVSTKTLELVEQLDNYVMKHFRIAFGNRIMKQLRDFTSVYVACGGTEIDAIDYFLAQKVLRKFDQLNIALIFDEIDEFIKYLDKEVGKGKMKNCIEFLERLKKSV